MSIPTPLLASLQPLQTRHHIQESPSFCKPQGYLLKAVPRLNFSLLLLLHKAATPSLLNLQSLLAFLHVTWCQPVPCTVLPCHVPSCLSMSPPVCLHLPTPARPLPYLPPSYQLPTLSILPSCAMACSESVPPTHQQHTSKCQGALPACCQASLYDHKYTEGDCTCILYLKRLTIGHGPIFDPPSFLMLRCCKF